MPANPAATAVTTASTPPKNKGKKRGRFTRADISRLVLFALIFAISLILGIHGKKAADLIAASDNHSFCCRIVDFSADPDQAIG